MPHPIIAVAMSGGVDSSTVAALLLAEGRRLIGFTMQVWDPRRLPELAAGTRASRVRSGDNIEQARQVARRLGIAHHVVKLQDSFERLVVGPFITEYLKGRTPIPCAVCNRVIKFGELFRLASEAGAERIATGHYARIRRDPATGRYQLLRGVDPAKDQSYFLFGMSQQQLARVLFPLGSYTKEQVREKARELGLPVAGKGESQEICFIPNGDYVAFIDAYFREQGRAKPDRRGQIVNREGKVLGEHAGVHRFTVGQRRGLGIATGEPLYVIATEPATQRVVVGRGEDLLGNRLQAAGVNWVSVAAPSKPLRARVRIRNQHQPAPATLYPGSEASRVEVRFDEPQRAITPGQAAVFYDGDVVLGGGWIE